MDNTLSKGVFLLSLDTELAWGGLHNGSYRQRADLYARTRSAVARLLKLLETYEIRATWAMVGHLLLHGCESQNRAKHPELVRPLYPWFRGDWLDSVPCSTDGRDPLWYAPDMVAEILACRTEQEIGCHTFSHIIVGDPGCSRRCFESELAACIEAAEQWKVKLTSFVFPRNSVGHLGVLNRSGFRAFRGRTRRRSRSHDLGVVGRALRGARWVLPMGPLTTMPERQHGMWCLPATSFYLHREGSARLLPVAGRVMRAKAGIREAESRRSLFHVYLHPFNLASDPDRLLAGLEEIFRLVAVERDSDRLDNPTMGGLARRLDGVAAERS